MLMPLSSMSNSVHDPNSRRAQKSAGNRGRLTAGLIYEGQVMAACHTNRTYTVSVNGEDVAGCIPALGFFSGLLGVKTEWRIPTGTRVLVVYGPRPYIVATYAGDVPDVDSFLGRTVTGMGVQDAIPRIDPSTNHEVPSHNTPNDLLEGELEISDLMGSFLRFMRFMTSVGAGERAQIQCHLLRDLVRIISGNYEHFSAAGDETVFDDGRLNKEEHGTTYPHERMGLLQDTDPLVEEPGAFSGEDFDPMKTGRWRWTRYLGFIGDLFNQWFTDPTETVGRMAEDALRSGKSRVWFGQGGDILVQSVGEIAIERVVRIPVPIRLKHPEDPEGVLREEMEKLDQAFLKRWNEGQQGDTEHHTLFQLRDYARWLSEYHSLARFHQLAKANEEFKIPSEEETPAPKTGAGEKDREEANTGALTYWKPAYSTFRLLRDGSSLLHDAWGNTVATGPYGIQMDTPRHFRVTSAGDISMTAGGSLFLGARRHVEISAHRGGMILKSRTLFRALCERGTMWLKSDFDPDNEYSPEENDPKAEVFAGQAMRLETRKGALHMSAGKKARLEVLNAEDDENGVEIQTTGTFAMRLRGKLDLEVSKASLIAFREDVYARFRNWIGQGTSWAMQGVAYLSRSGSRLNQVTARSVDAVSQLKGPRVGALPADFESLLPLPPHFNHCQITEVDPATFSVTEEAEFPVAAQIPQEERFTWRLLPEEEYLWVANVPDSKRDADRLFENLGQQKVRLDQTDGYSEWQGASDTLLPAEGTGNGKPWPGTRGTWLVCNPQGDSLNEPTSSSGEQLAVEPPRLTPTPIVMKVLNRD